MGDSWVLTGAGLVTGAGDTPQALLATLTAGVPRAAAHPDADFPVAAFDGFDAKSYLQKKGVKDLSRISQLACAAACGNAAGLAGVPVEEVGVVLGSAWGSLTTVVRFEHEAFVQGPRFVDPILFTETVANVPAGQVAIFFGWSAFNATVAAGPASGLAGILRGLDFLDEGRGKVAVAGGADELNLPLLKSLHARGAAGLVGGEGACFVTIESEEHARVRGASPLARVRTSFQQFSTDPASLVELLAELLRRASLDLRDIDLIVLPASGGAEGYAQEVRAVARVFGDGDDAPSVIAPKAILGECWAASGALAVVVAVEALRTRGKLRNAIVLDRSDSGHQIGIVLAAVEPQ